MLEITELRLAMITLPESGGNDSLMPRSKRRPVLNELDERNRQIPGF
jgi:hypothetical protein